MIKAEAKIARLRQQGLCNLAPEQVRAPWFHSGDFFDANDLVQTRYEMLRHVQIDGASKVAAAVLFGVSRTTYYQVEAAFTREGLAGLLPRQRGPKGPYKLTGEVMAFIAQRLQHDSGIHARSLAREIALVLNLSVHPRSIERAIGRIKKS